MNGSAGPRLDSEPGLVETSQGLEGDDEDEAVEVEDESDKEGDPRDQTRGPVLERLLLALAGIGVLKQ